MNGFRRFQAGFFLCVLISFLMAGCSRNPQKYIAQGKEYLARGRYNEAIIEFRNAIKSAPNLSEAHYQLAIGQLLSGQFTDAYESLLKTVQLNPGNSEAQLRLANLLLMESKFDEARTKAELILKRDAGNLRAQILLGNTYAQMLQLDSSIGEVGQGFQREPRLLPAYF
jgi:tetratricopeptide (TPR) repeat protein